jgi:hypothetical protein
MHGRLIRGLFPGIFALFFFVSAAFAGVTVHYRGKAKDAAAVEQVLAAARSEASRYGWEVKDANVIDASVPRNSGAKEKTYKGPLTGIVIYAHPMCEPVYIQFGTDLLMQDYVKTQFAGPDIHVKLIGLLRKIRPLLADLHVSDEGEYWETGDKAKLEMQIAAVSKMIEAIRKSHPNVKGPIKIGNGRIVDLAN